MLSLTVLLAAMIALSGMLVLSLSHPVHEVIPVEGRPATSSPATDWGVEVIGVRSTAAGHMLEFRYRVTDAEKATALFERKTQPYLLHHASGKVVGVPNTAKLGPLRNSNAPLAGRTYWMFFGNAGHLVKVGDLVTVTIGEFEHKDITVE